MTEIFSKAAPKWAVEHSEMAEGVMYTLNLRVPAVMEYGNAAMITLMVTWEVGEDGTLALKCDEPEIYIGEYTADSPEKARAMASMWSYAAHLLDAIQREQWDEFDGLTEPPVKAA